MKTAKSLFILFFLGVPLFYGYAQEKVLSDTISAQQSTLAETVQPTKTAFNDVGLMVKQVLGEVYTEVGHIPEPQWFEMEPIAEEYVKVLFEARAMSDGAAATQLSQDARAKFESAIKAKLTTTQKNTWNQKCAEEEIKMQHLIQLMSSVNEEARQALEDSLVAESTQASEKVRVAENPQVLKSNAQITKSISNQPGSKSVQFEFK